MNLTKLNDNELVTNFSDLLIEEQEQLVLQLEYLVELERRKLFFSQPSLWAFLVHERSMEEATAERRIRASRLLARFPWIKIKLESGELNLSLLDLAQATGHREKLSDEDFSEVLIAICGMSSRKARRRLASMYPRSADSPEFYDRISPFNDELSEIRFVAPHALVEKLEEIRDLLAHSHPGASLAEVIDVLASEFRSKHHPEEKAKRARERKENQEDRENRALMNQNVDTPRDNTLENRSPSAQKVPGQSMAHALVLRDGYRCSFWDDTTGRFCDSKHALQIDHILSYSSGGKTELQNLRFLCANHHRRVSFLEFGESSKYFRQKPDSL